MSFHYLFIVLFDLCFLKIVTFEKQLVGRIDIWKHREYADLGT